MKVSSGIPFSGVVFDRDANAPRYRQLYAHIRDLILRGALPAGLHLPSSRELAAELGIARNTVIAAYQLLTDEQFVESVPGRGTVVRAVPAVNGDFAASGKTSAASSERLPLRMGFAMPDPAHFPSPAWTRTLRNVVKPREAVPTSRLAEGDLRLRGLVCAYLGGYRGVRCHEDQVVITTGGQQALYLAGRVLREFTGDMLIEEPGYRGARVAFQSCGFRLLPVSVDECGARLEADFLSACEGPRALYLTPSHQFPLGATLSLERRLRALEWARREAGWIIEDDYDAEYRYDGEPLTALAGLDTAQRVIYAGTFSKVLSPELRIGYVVVPEPLIERFRTLKENVDGAPPALMQTAIADFLQNGHFQAHLRHMRGVYRGKRDRLLRLLDEHRVPVSVQPHPAGMHATLLLDDALDDLDVAREMAARGFETPALSRHYLDAERATPGLLAGFTSASDADLEDFVVNLDAVLALAKRE